MIRRVRILCYLWTTSSDSPKRVAKCPRFWDECHQPWVTSPPWRRKWVLCRSESLQRTKVPSRRFRQFMFRQMIRPILLRPRPLGSWMHSSIWNVRFQKREFTPLWIHWPHQAVFWIPSMSVIAITTLPVKSKRRSKDIVNFKISSPFSVWMN